MKKRLLVLIMAGLLLAGCGGNSDSGNVAGNSGLQNSDSVTGESDAAKTEVSGTEAGANETESNTEEKPYVFEFTDATTAEGECMSSDVFANSKLTMINVWATFCSPCISEMPDLGEIAGELSTFAFE